MRRERKNQQVDEASEIRRDGDKVKQNGGQPSGIMKERSSGRNCGRL
jgi:hypothetical protein